MMIKFTLSLASIIAFATSFTEAQNIKNSSSYLHTQSIVGVSVFTQIGYYGRTSIPGFGLVGAVVGALDKPSGGKYQDALNALEPTLNPTEKVNEFYKSMLSGLGKNVIVINEHIDLSAFSDFKGPKVTGKNYFYKDLRSLKDKYQVNEIMFVTIHYGVRSHLTYGVVESHRKGMTHISTNVVNLIDNSFVVKDRGREYWAPVDGEWNTPPEYSNLKQSISAAIDKGLAKEKEKYK